MWRNICNNLSRYSFLSEKEYQNGIIGILSLALGWHFEDIVEQPTLQLGSTERLIPDIVIKKEGKPQFIIEVKEPRHQQQLRNIQQLESYLKQVEVNFGLYFGEKIELYYKEFGEGKPAIRVFSVNFDEQDSKGDKFVELFSRNTFDADRLLAFCKEEINRQEEQKNIASAVNDLCSQQGIDLILDLLSKHYQEEGKTLEWINSLLDDVQIQIKKKATEPVYVEPCISSANVVRVHRRSGMTVQKLVLDLIKNILNDNLEKPYNMIYGLFGGYKNYIERVDNIPQKSMNRWFFEDENIFVSGDGVRFVISNQWGVTGNCVPKVQRLIDVARKQNVEIPEEILEAVE